MKNLLKITTAVFLLVQTVGFSQTENSEVLIKKEQTSISEQTAKTEMDTEKFKSFIGKYNLVEAGIILEIVLEEGKMYILSPGSKDVLIEKNETTLREPLRGVDLERIDDNKNALKFTQNGYETIIKRVTEATQN